MDLGAEQFFAAEKDAQKIIVEVKSFTEQSKTYAFHTALGQFNAYSVTLKMGDPERILFLAIPDLVYESYFVKTLFQAIIQFYHVQFILVNEEDETITKWIK